MKTLFELIYNLGILIAIGIIVGEYGKHRKNSRYVQGLIFGASALIGMLHPFVLSKGLNFDGRSIMLSIAGAYFGPITATIAATMALILRIYQGGVGQTMGILVIISSSIIGTFYYYFYYNKNNKITGKQLYQMGIIVHVTMLFCTLALPYEATILTVNNIILPVLLFYPIVTVLIGRIISQAEEKKAMMESFILFKDLVNNSSQGLGVITLSGEMKYLNDAIITLMKSDNSSNKDNSFVSFSSDYKDKILNKIIPEVLKTGKSQNELILKTISGETLILVENFFPIKDEHEKTLYIGYVVSDITNERDSAKKAKEALEEAEKANKAKTNFIANMSHELRTPMNGILGISKMLVKYDSENMTKDQIEGLELINKSGERLLNLINDVLDFSKVDSGEINPKMKEFNFSEFLREVNDVVKNLISNDSDKKNKIDFFVNKNSNVSDYIVSDEKFLNQILINLLGNSFKFTDNGKIMLNIYVEEDKLFFEVSDTGIGIRKEDLTKMFNKFTQLDESLTKKYKGTGLGLNICKSLVKKLKGDISIESNYNIGTTVKFFVNYYEGENKEKDYSHEIIENKDVNHLLKKVLVIEDDKESRYLYGKYLERHNYSVIYAEDGEEGLNLINSEEPDLVILDINLPKLNGLKVIEILKKENKHMNIPIIIISVEDLNNEYLLYGLSDFISKPVTEERLISSIQYIETHIKERRKKVMVIDDDEAELKQVKTFLKKNDYYVITVENSEMAFDSITTNKPDLIILDLLMPKVSGLEILHFIRNHEDIEISHVPVIVNSFKDLSENEFKEISELSSRIINKKYNSKENLVNLSMELIKKMEEPIVNKNVKSILIAEDDEIGRKIIERMLRDSYKITFAEDGEKAHYMTTKEKFDLILLDIRMPKLDGYDTYNYIRRNGIKTPIIALTAQALDSDRDKIMEFGFDEYISKPIRQEELLKKIEMFV